MSGTVADSVFMHPVTWAPHLKAFRGTNFVTPHIIGFWRGKHGYYELSLGHMRPLADDVWGVTVSQDGVERDYKRSKCLFSKQDALDYIRDLEGETNETRRS